MPDILINYRRRDSAIAAHVLYEVLNEHFPNQAFIDIDKIAPATDFTAVLREALRTCSVMISLIGHHWLSESLESRSNWVRLEIESALSLAHVTIIPTLLDGAEMPSPEALPRSIHALTKLNATSVPAKGYRAAVRDILVPLIKTALEEAEKRRAKPTKKVVPIEGDKFRDEDILPLMSVVPRGRFKRGSPESEKGSTEAERPVSQVTIASRIAVSVFPITAFEWNKACESGLGAHSSIGVRDIRAANEVSHLAAVARISEGGDFLSYLTDGAFRERLYPATGITWDAARAYCDWATGRTGRHYRLLSEAEWEYCCRAATNSAYATGNEITFAQANFNRRYKPRHQRVGGNASGLPEGAPRPVSACFENAFGLFGMHGNVWEWVEDCYHDNYEGAPDDHSSWIDTPRQDVKVLRGGCFASDFRRLRSASRGKAPALSASIKDISKIGFRVACEL